MNFLRFIAVFFLLMLVPGAFAAGTETPPSFLSALQDVPLPPGMVELTDQTTVFDKPEGRIVEAVVEMPGSSEDEARRFYADTLPQLGWKKAGEGKFRRDSEQLHISFETLEGRSYARFGLSPVK
ncbi:MAG: hypothetical protein ACT4OY_06740 [Alphaproteobacteria bacterium]